MVVLSKVRMLVDIFVNVLALTTNRNQLEFSCLQRLCNKRLRKCDSHKKATLNHHSHALMTVYHYVGRRNTLIRKRPDLTTFIFQFFFWEGRLKLYFCCSFRHSLHFQSIKLSTNKLLVHYWSWNHYFFRAFVLSTTVFIAITRKQTSIKILSTTNKSLYVYFTPKNVRHDEKVSISLFIHLWNAVSKNTSP